MTNRKRFPDRFATCALALLALLAALVLGCKPPDTKPGGDGDTTKPTDTSKPADTSKGALKIGYSDWPGWLVMEIAKQKGFFKEAGVDVELVWFGDYAASIDAYSAGKLDGILIDCG